MSAYPSLDRSLPADRWLTSGLVDGSDATPITHAIELACLFASPSTDRTDALQAETRRHLAGCLRSIETSLRLSLASHPVAGEALDQLPDPLCWPVVCARPVLIGPALLQHMRLRAGVSLVLRRNGRPSEHGEGEGVAADLFDPADPRLSEAMALLAIAEGRWAMSGSDDQPIRPDLPAERFAELLWMAVAILAQALDPVLPPGSPSAITLLADAGRTILSRHDEATGPLAAADRLVSHLGRAADDPALAAQAISQRRLTVYAALAGRRLRMDSLLVLDRLLNEPPAHIGALCSAIGASGVEFRHLLLTLQGARASFSDAVILAEAQRYADGDPDRSARLMAIMTAPPLLRASLDQLRTASAS